MNSYLLTEAFYLQNASFILNKSNIVDIQVITVDFFSVFPRYSLLIWWNTEILEIILISTCKGLIVNKTDNAFAG
jgi:hypothetical protein